MSFSLLSFRHAITRIIDADRRITKESFETFISIVASLCGMVHGFIATQSDLIIASHYLQEFEPDNSDQGIFQAHFLNVFYAGCLLGALCSFLFADQFGRKTTLMYSSLLSALSIVWYLLQETGDDILTARFLVGIFLGVLLTVCPVYVAEIATEGSRGQSVGFLSLSMVVGSLLAVLTFYALEKYEIGWRVSLVLPVVLLLAEAVLLFFLPASPRWLLAQQTPAKCLHAMRQLRRTPEVSKEFNEVYRALTSDAKLGHDWVDLLTTKSILLRLILVGVLEVSHLFVGTQLISVFGHQLFSDFGPESLVLGLLLVLLAQLLGTGVCLTHIDTLGRRTLLLWGCALMGLAWLCAAVCVYIATMPQEQRLFYNDDDRSHYLAVSSVYLTQFFFGCALCVYAFSFALSLGTITWVFCSEVFPYRTRAKAAATSMVCYYLSSMFNTSLYTLCVAGIGIWGQYSHENEVNVVAAPTAEGYWHGRSSFHYTLDVISAADMSEGSPEALLGHSKHHHGHHHGGPINNPAPVDVTVISADNTATLYLLKLASVSLILGLFVYLFIPETKDLRLEVMDELFRVDNNNNSCHCCPDVRTAGMLGLRALTEQQKGTHRSATKNTLGGTGGAGSERPTRSGSRLFQYGTAGDMSGDRMSMDAAEADYEDMDDIVPSSLHKYSAEMRGGGFSYYAEGEEDAPLVVPSFNLSVL